MLGGWDVTAYRLTGIAIRQARGGSRIPDFSYKNMHVNLWIRSKRRKIKADYMREGYVLQCSQFILMRKSEWSLKKDKTAPTDFFIKYTFFFKLEGNCFTINLVKFKNKIKLKKNMRKYLPQKKKKRVNNSKMLQVCFQLENGRQTNHDLQVLLSPHIYVSQCCLPLSESHTFWGTGLKKRAI